MDSFSIRFTTLRILLASSFFASTLLAVEHHGVRGGGIAAVTHADAFNVSEDSFQLVEDFPVVYPPDYSNRTTSHRRLATASGTRTLLFIRVIANNVAPTVSAAELRQAAFGSSNSLSYQMRVCSEGRLNVVQSPHGVKDLRINANPRDIRAMITESQRAAGQLGLGNIKSAANHIAWVFPEQGSAYVAEAEIIGSYSWYNNNLAKSHSVLVHEVGHNFGLDHAGIRGDEYGDYSGMMGRSTTTVAGPIMCYNAADHYRLGWYTGKRRDVGNGPWTGTLGAFVFSQQSSNPVVIRTSGNVYFQYNLAQAHNSGTRAMKNQVVIVKLLSNGHTEAQRGLSQGESWTDPSTGVRIQVCTLGAREAKVSVNSNCGSVSANSVPATSSSAAWGSNNNAGTWNRPSNNIFLPPPTPSFNVVLAPRPAPSFGWNTPSVSNVFSNFFNSAPKPAPQWNTWSSSARSSPSSSSWNLSWARGEVGDR